MACASAVLTGDEGLKGVLTLSQHPARKRTELPRAVVDLTKVASQVREESPTLIEGTISGLRSGKHGLHVHIFGDLSEGLASTGAIFNPFSSNHGAPDDEQRMVGDIGNLEADEDGIAKIHLEDRLVKLIGPHSVIGRSIVIKSGEDDYGRGGHELSLTTGNSGARIAGGIIGIAASAGR